MQQRLVHACQQSTGQLQQPTGWCQQPVATKAPSHPERCRSSCYRSQKIRALLYCDMTPILCDLHWLPVRRQITFKTAVLVYKCLHDMAPQYLQTYCEPTSTVATRLLRSAHSGRTTHQNKLRRQQFRRPRTLCMGQSSCCTASTRHYTDNVQEQTEHIFVQHV